MKFLQPIIIIALCAFIAFASIDKCSESQPQRPSRDTAIVIRYIDTSKVIYRDKIAFKTIMKTVRGTFDATTIDSINRVVTSADTVADSSRINSVTGFGLSDRLVFDTIINRDTLHIEVLPLSALLYFDRRAFADTAFFRIADTNKTITITVDRPRPWYEVPGYIGLGAAAGILLGLLAGGR